MSQNMSIQPEQHRVTYIMVGGRFLQGVSHARSSQSRKNIGCQEGRVASMCVGGGWGVEGVPRTKEILMHGDSKTEIW